MFHFEEHVNQGLVTLDPTACMSLKYWLWAVSSRFEEVIV